MVTLSTGLTFVSLADDQEYSSILTYDEVDSEKVWAMIEKDGDVDPILNANGNNHALSNEIEVEIENDKYYFSINGEKYLTGYAKNDPVQAFKCQFQADAQGLVYAVTFDFGNECQMSYFVTGYTGVKFRLPYGENAEAVSEYYVHSGSRSEIVLDIPQGVEYVLSASEGWKAEKKATDSAVYVEITAPEASASVTSGQLQVLSAAGNAVMSTLTLSAEPFHSVTTSSTSVIVTPYVGVRKFVYGLVELDLYADEDVVAKASGVAGGAAPAGCDISDVSVVRPITELLQGELDPDKRYVLWAVPVIYGDDLQATVLADAIRKHEFGAMSFDIEALDVNLLDAQLKVTVKGADAVFGGVVAKSEGFMDEIIYQVDNSIVDSIVVANQNFVFEGLMSDFPAVDGYKNEIEPAQTYVVWVAPAVAGDYKYSEADITYLEVTTNSVVPGGNIALTISNPVTTPSTFTADLNADGAVLIYYAILDKSTGDRYASAADADKYAQMMKKSPVIVRGSSVAAECKKLNPSTTYWIYAVAVDEDGKYGPVACVSGKTTKLEYDTTIKLTVEKIDVTAKKAVLKVTSTGGDLSDYIYWAGSAMDPFWISTSTCGGDKDIAQKYMALNPDDENIKKAMNKYGAIGEDGIITLNGLAMQTDYVFAILEKGTTNFSKVGYIKVTTLEADLGEIVVEGSAKWLAAKETVKIEWLENKFSAAENSQMQAYYAFNFSCPTNMTAYVLCASDLYYAEMLKIEDVMIDIENTASRRYDNGITPMVNGAYAQEPDYYKDGELRNGQLMNVYEFCVHGVPLMGFVTYFAKGSHGEGNCIHWENGKCTAYEYGMQSIAKFMTIDPWEKRAQQFGLKDQEAADWSKALLDAYTVFYKDATPVIYENNGEPIESANPYANGVNDEGLIPDRVIVMLKDLNGNYYHPMYFEVPNHFN